MKENSSNNKNKIVFFVKQGLDNFLQDVIDGLSNEYEIKKITVSQYNQIDGWMKWSDICWFEWCDELVIYGSRLDIARDKKIVCRLHSYEAFTDYITQVNWDNVDKLMFVGEYIRDIVLKKINIEKEKTIVIENGIDTDKYSFRKREKGFNIAYAGYINFKKGPMLLLHAFKAIYEKDKKYRLYIAGAFQEERYLLYFQHMIKEMGLQNNVIFDGWQDDLDKWLEDKDYILCTSLLESQNISVMQAMSKGIKPLIHNFPGASEIYPCKYLWNCIDEAVRMALEEEYNPWEYRSFIDGHYSLKGRQEKILNQINCLNEDMVKRSFDIKPLVTIGIMNYNYNKYLDAAVASALNQNYDNIEILIVDDFSTDGSIEKIRQYEEKYQNIKGIYHSQNSGSAVLALKEIIGNARGEYLIFLSADDYFYNDEVVKNYLHEFLSDSSLDYVYGNLQLVDDEGRVKETWKYKNYSDKEIVHNTFRQMGSGVIPLTTGMFKTEFFRRNNLTFIDDPDNRVAGDTLNTLIYLKYGFRRKYAGFASLCYRQHSSNMTYDLKSRIKSIISVMEYALQNFDIAILFPEVQWDKFNEGMKEAAAMFIAGGYYYKTLSAYYYGDVKDLGNEMELDKEQLREYVQPLIGIIEKYLDKSLEKSQVFSQRINSIKLQIEPLKLELQAYVASSKSNICQEGQKLRKSLLAEYQNRYRDKNLRILIYAPDNGNWKYAFTAWKDILQYMGAEVTLLNEATKNNAEGVFDIFINIADKHHIENAMRNKNIVSVPHKIGIASKQGFFTSSQCTQQDLMNIDIINSFNYDFLVSSFSQSSIDEVFKEWIDRNITIISIPFGFNPLIHYPEEAPEIYDYFIVGTNSYSKAEETNKYLLHILRNFKGILRGANWGPSIPKLHPNNCRFFYSRARINLNYHLKSQKEFENEVNERTFVIPACGGFQLVDSPKILNKYYTEKEAAIANDEKEYLEKFIYYLNKPEERHEIAYNALIRTYDNKCSLFHRLEGILNRIF